MGPRGIVFICSFLIVLVLVVVIDRLLPPSLRQLLEDVIGLAAATEFYLAVLLGRRVLGCGSGIHWFDA